MIFLNQDLLNQDLLNQDFFGFTRQDWMRVMTFRTCSQNGLKPLSCGILLG